MLQPAISLYYIAIIPRLSLEGFITNATNRIYIATQQTHNSSDTDGGILYGAPRQYGARVIAHVGE